MQFVGKQAKVEMPIEKMDYLIQCSRFRTESAAKVHRAKILLGYHDGESLSKIAREMRTNPPAHWGGQTDACHLHAEMQNGSNYR